MKISIQDVFENNSAAYQTWGKLKQESNVDIRLLYPLSPFFDYLYKGIQQDIQEIKSSRLQISDTLIKTLVATFFKDEIAPITNRVFVNELHNAKASHSLNSDSSKARFNEFLDLISCYDAIAIIFKKYTPIEKSVLICINQFRNFVFTLLKRFNNDFKEINEKILFFKKVRIIKVFEIQTSGDKHNHGNRVAIVKAGSSANNTKKIVYKPRDLSMLLGFNSFISWVNDNTTFNFTTPLTLFRKKYGWQQFVQNFECEEIEDVNSFFFHLGGLLCIFHLLNSQDIHSENIISHGKQPVLVDCECLLTPVLNENNNKQYHARNLVCNALILPNRNMYTEDYSGFDNSVIGNEAEQELPFTVLSWEKEHTDEMKLKRVTSKTVMHRCRPSLHNKVVDPLEYQEKFLYGFSEIYNFFLSKKGYLLNTKTSPIISCFDNCLSRVIIRPTVHYTKLIAESFHPLILYDSEKRHEHFKFLEKSLHLVENYKAFLISEKSDLSELNIPIFYSKSNHKLIYDDNGETLNIKIILTPINHSMHNLREFWGESDLEIQKTIIKNSFISLTYNNGKKCHAYNAKTSNNKNIDNYAASLVKLLMNNAICEGGKVDWPTIVPAGDKVTQSITDQSLYNGNLGIFYTIYLYGIMYKENCYITFAKNNLCALLNDVIGLNRPYITLGLYDGLGGLLLVLSNLKKLGEEIKLEFFDDTASCFDYIVDSNKKQTYDIMSGYAGFLCALVEAKEFLSKNIFQKYSTACLEEILLIVNKVRKMPEIYLASFAHGVTGIYYSLSKILAVSYEQRAEEAINFLISIENDFYDAKQNAWKDLRYNNSSNFTHAWCHGTTGIGLTKMYLHKISNNPSNMKHLKSAVSSNINHCGFNNDFSLCHGITGNLDFLLELENNPSLLKTAIYDKLIYKYMESIENKEIYFYNLKEPFIPGLFDGFCGVLYFLLRLEFKGKIPSILLG